MRPNIAHWVIASAAALGVHGVFLQGLNASRAVVPFDALESELNVTFLVSTVESASTTQARSNTQPVIEAELPSESEPESKLEPELVSKPEPEPVLDPIPKPTPKAKPNPKPKPKPKSRPEPISTASKSETTSHSSNTVSARSTRRKATSNEDVSKQLTDYFQTLGRRFERAKKYPRKALVRRQQGTVKLRLLIAIDGSLLKAEIATASPHRVLNNAALKLARASSPFPTPPVGAKIPLEVLVPIAYRIQ